MKTLLFVALLLSTLNASELEKFLKEVDIQGIVGVSIDKNKGYRSSRTSTQAKGVIVLQAPIGENTKAVVTLRGHTPNDSLYHIEHSR